MSGKYKLEAVRDLDNKGRLTIPRKIRKATKYMISFDGERILLEGVKE